MNNSKMPHEVLLEQTLKELDNSIESLNEMLINTILEMSEYHLTVGKIQSLIQAKTVIKQKYNTIFPNE